MSPDVSVIGLPITAYAALVLLLSCSPAPLDESVCGDGELDVGDAESVATSFCDPSRLQPDNGVCNFVAALTKGRSYIEAWFDANVVEPELVDAWAGFVDEGLTYPVEYSVASGRTPRRGGLDRRCLARSADSLTDAAP